MSGSATETRTGLSYSFEIGLMQSTYLGVVNSLGLGGGTLTPNVINPQLAWAGRITVLVLSVLIYYHKICHLHNLCLNNKVP